jgi:uncharacterized coiled-coil protein SlyX
MFEHHLELFHAATYPVQSSVPLDVFESFVHSLTTQTKLSVTKENAGSLSLLAKEFSFNDLAEECAAFSVPSDPMSSLPARVCKLELQVSSLSAPPRELEEAIESQERALEGLRCETEQKIHSLDGTVARLDSTIEKLERKVDSLTDMLQEAKKVISSFGDEKVMIRDVPSERVKMMKEIFEKEKSLETTNFKRADWMNPAVPYDGVIPLKKDKPLDGIISALNEKHSGNVQEKGIVTITAKSVSDDPTYALKNVADLASDSEFWSKDGVNQWTCWDFRQLRVKLTHYTLRTANLKSWILEGSVDGRRWTKIDRQTDNQELKDAKIASVAVSNPTEFRFVRLTQLGQNRSGDYILRLSAVEFFGTLSTAA